MQVTTASELQMNFMKLLVTQLQNQNPLEPLSNNEMASQLAQFSSLQQLEEMNRNFEKVLANATLSYANSLLGKQVGFFDPADGTLLLTGTVQLVRPQDGEVLLQVGEYLVRLEDVQVIGA
jgi:flagellar basal-body rod modification protein FlgD